MIDTTAFDTLATQDEVDAVLGSVVEAIYELGPNHYGNPHYAADAIGLIGKPMTADALAHWREIDSDLWDKVEEVAG